MLFEQNKLILSTFLKEEKMALRGLVLKGLSSCVGSKEDTFYIIFRCKDFLGTKEKYEL